MNLRTASGLTIATDTRGRRWAWNAAVPVVGVPLIQHVEAAEREFVHSNHGTTIFELDDRLYVRTGSKFTVSGVDKPERAIKRDAFLRAYRRWFDYGRAQAREEKYTALMTAYNVTREEIDGGKVLMFTVSTHTFAVRV